MAKKSKFGFLSSNVLKVIAVIAMVIDHSAVVFSLEPMALFRGIGRLAFPIFAFLIAQGAVRSKNRLKYILRLTVFAFISEIPFDLAFGESWFDMKSQNVYFTLTLGLLSCITYDFLSKKNLGILALVSTFIFGLGAFFLRSDYGFMGVIVITLMAVFSSAAPSVKFIGLTLSAFMTSIVYMPPLGFGFLQAQLPAVLSAVPLSLYNGKRGKRVNKYIFYAFYPAHILVLFLIKTLVS